MRRNLIIIPAVVIMTSALYWFNAYAEDMEISIIFDRISGIGPGSKLVLGGVPVGEVKGADITDGGNINVEAKIYKEYKDRVNSSSVFIIESADTTEEPDKKQITVEVLSKEAPPFSQGARAEGYSSRSQFLLRTEKRALEDPYRKFENWLNEFQKELKELREGEKGKKLKNQMQELMEEARRSAEKGIEEFKKEIPHLKERFDEIIKELRKPSKDREASKFRNGFNRYLEDPQNRIREA
jgi:MlaD protein